MKKFLWIAVWCLGFLFMAEGGLRLLPVSQGFYLDSITPDQPVARRLPDRMATSSKGWKMSEAVTVPINAQGFIHADNFTADASTPLTVLIGDSQIEAPLMPWEKSLSQGLGERLNDATRVYPVGMSGAPLSQYLIWYRHMTDRYTPQTVVFFISPNDYDESFAEYGLFPGFHYFTTDSSGDVSLQLRSYRRSLVATLASSSSLIAYVLNNLDGISYVSSFLNSAKSFMTEQPLHGLAASAPADTMTSDEAVDQARLSKGLQAINLFFERLPRNGERQPQIVFAMNPDPSKNTLSDAFRHKAQALGYAVLELEPAFERERLAHGQELTFPGDVHWNAAGQAVVAGAVAAYLCPACDGSR